MSYTGNTLLFYLEGSAIKNEAQKQKLMLRSKIKRDQESTVAHFFFFFFNRLESGSHPGVQD